MLTRKKFLKVDKYLITIMLIILTFSMIMLFTSCSSNYEYKTEIVGKWGSVEEGEESEYMVFLKSGEVISTRYGDYPVGTYSIDSDGSVTVSFTDGEESAKINKDGSKWLMVIGTDDTLCLQRESTDISFWEDKVENLDHGDRLAGTTWYFSPKDGYYTYLHYGKDDSFIMEGSKNYYEEGNYNVYYGTEAILFLRNSNTTLWTEIDDFQTSDGTYFADEIFFSDGESMIDYGYLKDGVMETAIAGLDSEPVFYYQQ